MKLMGIIAVLALGFAGCEKSGGDEQAKNTFRWETIADTPGFNFLVESEAFQQEIVTWAYETLLDKDPDTYETIPLLAKKWEISADKKTFTFELDEKAKWFDGQPVTSADVAFTLDAMLGDKLNSGVQKAVYGSLDPKVEIIDEHKFKIHAKTKHFKNFDLAGGFQIVPKHLLENADLVKGPLVTKTLGSGPYQLEQWKTGDRIIFKKNPNYWGMHLKQNQGAFNFDKLVYKIVREPKIGIELLKQGFPTAYSFTAERWETDAKDPKIQEKYDTYTFTNRYPKGYTFIAWNNTNPLFKEKNVRLALSHLLNRPFIIQKFFYGHAIPSVGPILSTSDYAPKDAKAIDYDPSVAAQLLKKEGWIDSNKDGILDKGGKKFEFTLMFANPENEKYLTVYKEDLAKVGVRMNLQKVDWTTFVKLLDERKYESCILGWTAQVDVDLAQIWSSKSIENAGSNFVGYRNAKVDELITKIQEEFDRPKRIAMSQQIARIIADDAPYTFFLERPEYFIAALKGVKRVKDHVEYGNGFDSFAVGSQYWMPAQ